MPEAPSQATPLTRSGWARFKRWPLRRVVMSEFTTIVVIGSLVAPTCDSKLGVLNLPLGKRYAALTQKFFSGGATMRALVSCFPRYVPVQPATPRRAGPP